VPVKKSHQCVALFLLLFSIYAYVHQGWGYNQSSRLNLLHALFVHRTFTIDAYHTNTGDKAFYNGHYYSEKAPGIAVLALPAFSVAVLLLSAFSIPLDSPLGWHISDWMATAGSVGLITALGGVAIFSLLHRFLRPREALLVTLAIFLGSLPFSYATVLFSHGAVIGLLSIALWMVIGPEHKGISSLQRDLIAGGCAGLAVASDYLIVFAAGGIFLLQASLGFRRTMHFLSAALPVVLLIPLYNILSFDSPFVTGYNFLDPLEYPHVNVGFHGITFPPQFSHVLDLLIGSARGLFFWSPIFLLVFVGWPMWHRISRVGSIVGILVSLAHVLMISGFAEYHGGWALGPRYLSPIIPFLAVPAALVYRQFPSLGNAFVLLSILLTGTATLISAQTPEYLQQPLVDFYFPRLLHGEIAHNLGTMLGLHGWWSLLPLLLVVSTGVHFARLRCNRA